MSRKDRTSRGMTSGSSVSTPNEQAHLEQLEQKLDALLAYTSRLEAELHKTQKAYSMAQETVAALESQQQQTAEKIASTISYLQHIEASQA